MTQSPEVRIAILETKNDKLESDLAELKSDVRIIRDTLTEAKGGWKLFMIVGGIGAAIGGLVAKFMPFITFRV